MPNGIVDHVVKTREALLRLYALQEAGRPTTRLMQEGEDVLGHIALGLAHAVMGMNKGKLSLEIENVGEGVYVGRKESCVETKDDCQKKANGVHVDKTKRSAD